MHEPTGADAPRATTDTNPYRDALAVVLEAIDMPAPATAGDVDRYRQVLEDRVRCVRVSLRAIVQHLDANPGVAPDDGTGLIAFHVRYLRESLAEIGAGGYRTAAQLAGRDADGGASR